MDQLTPRDALRYEKLKKEAVSNTLSFRTDARRSAENYPRSMRQLLDRANTKDVPIYDLFSDWEALVAPQTEALQPARKSVALRNALAKQLNLSSSEAVDLAGKLVDERSSSINNTFLNHRYDPREQAREVASGIINMPAEEISDLHDRFISYRLHELVARESKITFYDTYAPLIRRLRQRMIERRQINRYKKQQSKRLEAILMRQQELKAHNRAIVSRILLLELDTVIVLDAYRQYKKQLDKLKPENITPAKRLSLFDSATKKIRESHASKQSTAEKLTDIQNALKSVDDVLVELFDMTDTERNALMSSLKEYRDLEREASRITKEQSIYAN